MKSILWNVAHRLYQFKLNRFARIVELLYFIINSNSISAQAKIGGETIFFHHGVGCVVHSRCRIGEHCKIFQNVTIGSKWADNQDPGRPPTIGNHVLIGAGAVLLGDIHIGDYSKIGANAVVLTDVPPYGVAVGIPAKIIKAK